MTATGPFKAQGTTLSISNETTATAFASATFKQVGSILNLPEIGGERSIIDTTDLSATAKTKLAGIIDAGSVTFNINYLEGDDGQDEVAESYAAGDVRWIKVDLGGDATGVWHCAAIVKSNPVSGDLDSKLGGSITFELTGTPVWA